MSVTWFLPIFVILFVYACRGQRQWVGATIVASFFQAATPILLSAGGRLSGLQTAYALLPIGVFQFIVGSFQLNRQRQSIFRISEAHMFLIGMTVIGVVGAFMLPKLFRGVAHVTTPPVFHTTILRSSSGNAIQAFYLVCNLSLFTLVVACIQRGAITVSQCIRALAVGTICSAVFGLYQIVCDALHAPWIDVVINSNLGVAQNFNQPVHGLPRLLGISRRMSATFQEPSMMSMYFLAMFAMFAVGLRRFVLGGTVLFCLLISTSATATAGLVVIFGIWMAWEFVGSRLDLRKASFFALIGAAVFAVFLAVTMMSDHWAHANYITEKLSSTSGQTRMSLDKIALHTFFETWGLGVGVGSTRSSSFIATFGACTGVPGLFCMFGFFGIVIFKSLSSEASEIRAVGLACAALFVGWLISIPDLAMPIVWVVSGVAAGQMGAKVTRDSFQVVGEASSKVSGVPYNSGSPNLA